MKRRHIAALGLLALLVTLAIAWALRSAPISVATATLTRGPFEQSVSEDGKTRVRDRYVVSAPLAGRLERIRLRVGDVIAARETVALLAPTAPALLDARTERELLERVGAAEAHQLRARAEMQRADVQLSQARADQQRSAKLAAGGFLSTAAREQSELAVRNAEKAGEAARFLEHAAAHDVDQARAALARYRTDSAGAQSGDLPSRARWEVKSPVSGLVLRVLQENEGVVAAGAPLLEIANPRSLEAVVDVLSQDAVDIRPGMPARVRISAGGAPLAATVRHVEPSAFTKISALGIEEQRVNVILDFVAATAPEPRASGETRQAGDGYRIDAEIVVHREADALRVPLGAMFRSGNDWSVWVLEDGRARLRKIKVSRRNTSVAMLEDGLRAGDIVLLYPPDAVRDGSRVTPGATRATTP